MKTHHWHHIIPKHAGGTDDPSNLVRLTVAEHADAHRLLWEQHGRPEDKLAWLLLSGKTEEAEAARIELAKHVQQRRWQDPVARQAQATRMKGNTFGVGREWTPTEEIKQRISVAQKERFARQPHNRLGAKHTEETKQKISEKKKGTRLSAATKQKISAKMKGRVQTDYQKQRVREVRSKQWEIITPTGECLHITNLRQFCKDHGLSQGSITTHGHTKGYRARKLP